MIVRPSAGPAGADSLRRAGSIARDLPLLVPAALFFATAVFATVLATQRPRAEGKLVLLSVALLILPVLASCRSLRQLRIRLAAVVAVGLGLGLVFVATNDWRDEPVKSPALALLGEHISGWLSVLPVPSIPLHPNAAGGTMMGLLPFLIALALSSRDDPSRARRGVMLLVWGTAVAFASLVLVLSAARSAWLATAAWGALWIAWRMANRHTEDRRSARDVARLRRTAVALLVLVLSSLVVLFLLVRTGQLPGGERLANRLWLQEQSVSLLQDYPLTGFGLGSFGGHYSLYAVLLDVRFVGHSHTLLLDPWLEQGLLGFVSLVMVFAVASTRGIAAAVRGGPAVRRFAEAGVASQIGIVIDGIGGNTLYSTRSVVFFFVAAGVMHASYRLADLPRSLPTSDRRRAFAVSAVVALCVVLGPAVLWRNTLVAMWDANMGALRQARIELAHYNMASLQNPSLDQVRREQDLSGVMASFERALARDPENPTARRRLAMMAMSQGRYEAALEHARAGWQAGHHDQATRRLLTDALAASGDVGGAASVALGASVDLAEESERLHGQAWFRYWMKDDAVRAAHLWAVAVRVNPQDTRSAVYLDRARQRLAAEAERRP